jgi:hypothetical protein
LIFCFSHGDFSPVLPLTVADMPLLRILEKRQLEEKEMLFALQADIRFYLERLSGAFTGDNGEFLPSNILKMAKRFERIKQKTGLH